MNGREDKGGKMDWIRQIAKITRNRKTRKHASALLVALVLSGAVTGCQTAQKAVSKEKVNLRPFADLTIAMAGSSQHGFRPEGAILVRPYFENLGALADDYETGNDATTSLTDAIVDYSLFVVTLADMNLEDTESVTRYADYLEKFEQRVASSTGLNPSEFGSTVDAVRQQKKLLDALKAAQPIINAVTQQGEKMVDELEKRASDIQQHLAKEIDADFATILSATELLKNRRDAALLALEALQAYEQGDGTALDTLRKSSAIRDKELLAHDVLQLQDIEAVEQVLFKELKNVDTVEKQLSDQVKLYNATQTEMNGVYTLELARLAKIRRSYIVWARIHHMMATGVTDPAKWLSIVGSTAGLFNSDAWNVVP